MPRWPRSGCGCSSCRSGTTWPSRCRLARRCSTQWQTRMRGVGCPHCLLVQGCWTCWRPSRYTVVLMSACTWCSTQARMDELLVTCAALPKEVLEGGERARQAQRRAATREATKRQQQAEQVQSGVA